MKSQNDKWQDVSGSRWLNVGGGASGPQSTNSFSAVQSADLKALTEEIERDRLLKNRKLRNLQQQLDEMVLTATQVAESATEAAGKKISDEMASLKQEVDKIGIESEKAKRDLKQDRLQSIQILAIFVAFFTFTSISFQMFANVNKAYWMPLGLLILGGVLLFSTVTSVFSLWTQEISRSLRIIICVLAVVATGAVLLGAGLHLQALSSYEAKEKKCWDLVHMIQKEHDESTQSVLQSQYENTCSTDIR